MANHYSERVLVTAPLMMLVERMRRIQGFAIRNECGDGYGGVFFKITNDISAMSWGEDISIHMHIANDQQTVVEFESKNANPVQIGDFGKNKKNIEAIKGQLLAGLTAQTI